MLTINQLNELVEKVMNGETIEVSKVKDVEDIEQDILANYDLAVDIMYNVEEDFYLVGLREE